MNSRQSRTGKNWKGKRPGGLPNAARWLLQAFPRANGGRFEKTAKEILKKKLGVPVTTACEMSDEVDVLRRGAGTL